MIVTAVAWTRVSRSGHCTFLSSAQQEAKKPSTPPRWRSADACFCLLGELLAARGASARLACAFRPPWPPSPRPAAAARALFGASGVSRRLSGAPAAIPASTASISAMSPETGTWVSCWARDSLPSAVAGALLLLLFAGAALGLALCAGFRHRPLPRSPCAPCDGRTSGRTCASRSGPASFAATCWSDSCAACSLRKPASPRCGHLREP